jgi:hypothetical protein
MSGLEFVTPDKMKFYDKFGKEIGENEWVQLIKFPAYRIVKQEWVGASFISTCWLTTEHFGGMFFETKVFHGREEESCHRYPTIEEAEKGHQEIVDELK